MDKRRIVRIFIFLLSFLLDVCAFADSVSSATGEKKGGGVSCEEHSERKDFTKYDNYVNISQK